MRYIVAVLFLGCVKGKAPTGPSASEQKVLQLEQRITDLENKWEKQQKDESRQDDQFAELSASVSRLKTAGVHGGTAPRPPVARPDPALAYSVKVADYPFVGPANAKVTIVKVYEYACPYCEKTRTTEKSLLAKYGKDLRIVYRPFIVHPQVATMPSQAACAAHKQGKFSAMNEILWDDGFKNGQKFAASDLSTYATKAGLNLGTYGRDFPKCEDWIKQSMTELRPLGVTGTPAFFVNGRFIGGAQPEAVFETLIDEELKKANDAISAGTKQNAYYDSIVKSGKLVL